MDETTDTAAPAAKGPGREEFQAAEFQEVEQTSGNGADGAQPNIDVIRLKFHNTKQLEDAALADFLQEHHNAVAQNGGA